MMAKAVPSELQALITKLVIPSLDGLRKEWKLGADITDKELPDSIGEALSMNLVKTYYFWSSPNIADLETQAKQWSQYLQDLKPQDKFTFSYYFSPNKASENWYSNTYNLGSIAIGRTLTPGGGMALGLPLQNDELHQPQQVNSEEMYRAVVFALPPQTLLTLNRNNDVSNSKVGKWIQDVLIHHAITEIDREEVFFDVGGTPPEEKRWPFLKRLLEWSKNNRKESTATMLASMSAAMEFYKNYVPGLGNFKLNRKIGKYMGEMEDIGDSINISLFDRTKTTFQESLQVTFNNRKKLLVDLKDRDNARHQLLGPAQYRLQSSEMLLENNLIKAGE